MLFCRLLNVFDYFNSFSYTIRVSISLSGLIWVKTVCKAHKQTTLVGKELLFNFINLTQVHNFTVSAQDIFTFR